jgi:hypothetical protein
MERILITVGCLLLAGWQFYVSYGELRRLKTKRQQKYVCIRLVCHFLQYCVWCDFIGAGLANLVSLDLGGEP